MRLRRFKVLGLFVCLFSWGFPGVALAQDVVASFSILGDLARRSGPVDAAVYDLVGPAQDAHHFEARPSDLKILKNAKLIFRIGVGFEPWLDRALKASGSKARVVTVSEGLPLRDGSHSHHARDPHVWQDPRLGVRIAETLRLAWRDYLPGKAEEIDRRAEEFKNSLAALHLEIEKGFSAIPRERRVIITSHDAFGYFGEAYGLTILSPQGPSTEMDPSAKNVAKLIRDIRSKKVQALFLENLANPKTLRQISRETGARIGGVLYADSLSEPEGPATTYEKLLRSNAETVQKALKEE